ncbi:hypothetical protein TNCV_3833111 [Trichonephila clavipes]|nr:hypothetical protein TNCV_3833111 [Trichonephila clavipes]
MGRTYLLKNSSGRSPLTDIRGNVVGVLVSRRETSPPIFGTVGELCFGFTLAQNCIKLRSPIWDIRSSELDAKRPYREVPYCIDTYWNSGKLRGRVSLMRSGIYRAHKEYEASM